MKAHPPKTWEAAKLAYVEGRVQSDGETRVFPTYEQVGETFGIALSTILKRAAKDGWKTQQDMYRQKLADARQQKRANLLAAKGAEFDSQVLRVQESILKQVEFQLKQADKLNKPVAIGELSKMAGLVATAHKSGRLAMGDTTEIEKLVTPVPEFDLTLLDDEDLRALERMHRKMGLAAPAVGAPQGATLQ